MRLGPPGAEGRGDPGRGRENRELLVLGQRHRERGDSSERAGDWRGGILQVRGPVECRFCRRERAGRDRGQMLRGLWGSADSASEGAEEAGDSGVPRLREP